MSGNFKQVTPVLHISESTRAEQFYCAGLGFQQAFANRPTSATDPCYMGLRRDSVEIDLSSFSDDGISGGVALFLVADVDALHAEFVARNVPIDTPPITQAWGLREMYVRDPDGNKLRFAQSST